MATTEETRIKKVERGRKKRVKQVEPRPYNREQAKARMLELMAIGAARRDAGYAPTIDKLDPLLVESVSRILGVADDNADDESAA